MMYFSCIFIVFNILFAFHKPQTLQQTLNKTYIFALRSKFEIFQQQSTNKCILKLFNLSQTRTSILKINKDILKC